jgi:hypothetical protein
VSPRPPACAKALIGAAVCLIVLACCLGCGGPATGAALVQAKCQRCHSLTTVANMRQGRSDWERTLKVMEIRGLKVSDDERAKILDYMERSYGR